MLTSLLFATAVANGSDDRLPDVHVDKGVQPPDLALAYRSHVPAMHHPGVDGQLTWDLLRRDVTRAPRSVRPPLRHRTRDVYVGVDTAIESHLTNHTFWRVEGLVGTRVTWTRGMFGAVNLGLGGQRSFLNHSTWYVDDAGDAQKIVGAGQFSATATVSGELGFDLARRRAHRIRRGVTQRGARAADVQWFVRPHLTGLLGWSGASFPVPVAGVDVGIRVPLGSGGAR